MFSIKILKCICVFTYAYVYINFKYWQVIFKNYFAKKNKIKNKNYFAPFVFPTYDVRVFFLMLLHIFIKTFFQSLS